MQNTVNNRQLTWFIRSQPRYINVLNTCQEIPTTRHDFFFKTGIVRMRERLMRFIEWNLVQLINYLEAQRRAIWTQLPTHKPLDNHTLLVRRQQSTSSTRYAFYGRRTRALFKDLEVLQVLVHAQCMVLKSSLVCRPQYSRDRPRRYG